MKKIDCKKNKKHYIWCSLSFSLSELQAPISICFPDNTTKFWLTGDFQELGRLWYFLIQKCILEVYVNKTLIWFLYFL